MSSGQTLPSELAARLVHDAGGVDPTRSRILLISYHYPPNQVVGALRWEKLTGLAVERGWQVDVLTLDPAAIPSPDNERLRLLPPGTRVFAVHPIPLASDRVLDGLARVARRARRDRARDEEDATVPRATSAPTPEKVLSLRPDEMRWPSFRLADYRRFYDAWRHYTEELAWCRDAIRIGRALVSPQHRVVISCGPPHIGTHDAAREVAAYARLPFVIDLRDPWAIERRLPEAYASPFWFALSRRVERRCVATARVVVTNTEPVATMMRSRYPTADVISVMNGYDDDEIPRVEKAPRFTIAYAGAIYLDRDPRPLLRAAARVVRELALTPDDFAIEMIGNVETYGGPPLSQLAREEGIGAYVHPGGRRSRREALEFLARAQMLVSLPQDSKSAVPSKVFEFMLFDAWMLALAESGSATEVVLRGSAVDVADPNDDDAMAAAIRKRVKQWRRGERPARAAEERFSRRYQAAILFDALDRAAGAPTGAAPRAAAGAG